MGGVEVVIGDHPEVDKDPEATRRSRIRRERQLDLSTPRAYPLQDQGQILGNPNDLGLRIQEMHAQACCQRTQALVAESSNVHILHIINIKYILDLSFSLLIN